MQNLDKTFTQALNLCDKTLSHENLILLLRSGNVVEKQYAALQISEILNYEEAHILVENIEGVDGKIREAAAFKLKELISDERFRKFFAHKSNYEKFAKAVIDIDSNVCRQVIESACFLLDDSKFSIYFANKLKEFIYEALIEIETFTFRDKKYKINKQIFKIYWCLEALFYFYANIEYNDLKEILTVCSELPEYTVREKCACILQKCEKDESLMNLKNKLSNDDNYYVRLIS